MTSFYVSKFLYYAGYFTLNYVVYFTTVYLYKNFFEHSTHDIKIKDFLRKNMTFASFITFYRLVLITPICEAIICKAWTHAFWYTVLAGLTDVLDGFFARYFNRETAFGAFLDAFVDKILISSVIWTFLREVQLVLPFKVLGISIIIKEVIQLLASSYLFVKGTLKTVKPSLWGKASMFSQLLFVLFLMLNRDCSYVLSLWITMPVFVLLFASVISYGSLFMRLIKLG